MSLCPGGLAGRPPHSPARAASSRPQAQGTCLRLHFLSRGLLGLSVQGWGRGRVEVSGAEAPRPTQVTTWHSPGVWSTYTRWSLQGGHPNQDAGGALGLQLQRADPGPQGSAELPALSQEGVQWWVFDFFFLNRSICFWRHSWTSSLGPEDAGRCVQGSAPANSWWELSGLAPFLGSLVGGSPCSQKLCEL